MSLKRKLEGEIEIREAAGHVFHDMYKHTPHHLSHASPDFVQSCDLHEGQLGKPGSVVLWKYKLGIIFLKPNPNPNPKTKRN